MATPVTASTVRDYFQADEARMARLSPEGAKSVQPGARGRLSAEAVKVFNAKRRANRRYVLGATGSVAAASKAEAAALRAKAEQAGVSVGARGPLSNEAKAALGL